MTNIASWNPQPAEKKEELMNVLYFSASALKTQVIASPILSLPVYEQLKARLSAIADELNGLQQDIEFLFPFPVE